MEFKAAICPNCGADLRLPEDKKILKCMYCGKDVIVHDAIEKASGPTIENLLALAKSALQSNNVKEAYDYYNKVLELNPTHYEAWLGKAESAGWQSTIAEPRLRETMNGVETAIKFAPENLKGKIRLRSADILNRVAVGYHNLSLNHMFDYGRVGNGKEEFYTRCQDAIYIWELANSYAPNNVQIIDNIIAVTQLQIEGVNYKEFNQYGEYTAVSHVNDDYAAKMTAKMNEYIAKRGALDPLYQAPTVKKKGGCFIITATMGSENHPHVLFLRIFRDSWLSTRVAGRLFIEKYYKYSPYFANVIQRRAKLKRISYVLIVIPSVRLAKKLMRRKANHNTF
jgi:tetratricopeptide (TPR) repeat protein